MWCAIAVLSTARRRDGKQHTSTIKKSFCLHSMTGGFYAFFVLDCGVSGRSPDCATFTALGGCESNPLIMQNVIARSCTQLSRKFNLTIEAEVTVDVSWKPIRVWLRGATHNLRIGTEGNEVKSFAERTEKWTFNGLENYLEKLIRADNLKPILDHINIHRGNPPRIESINMRRSH